MSAFTYPFYRRISTEDMKDDFASKPHDNAEHTETFAVSGETFSHGNEVHAESYIPEAPTDGINYARKDGSWTQTQGMENHGNEYHTSTFVPEAPTDGINYARKDGSWTQTQGMENHGDEWHTEDYINRIAELEKSNSILNELMMFDSGDVMSPKTLANFYSGDVMSTTTMANFYSGDVTSATTTS